MSFGVSSDRESIDNNFNQLIKMTMGEYMDNWPNHKDGLWGETIEIAERIGLNIKIDYLKMSIMRTNFKELLCLPKL